jgi:hypothetical protein
MEKSFDSNFRELNIRRHACVLLPAKHGIPFHRTVKQHVHSSPERRRYWPPSARVLPMNPHPVSGTQWLLRTRTCQNVVIWNGCSTLLPALQYATSPMSAVGTILAVLADAVNSTFENGQAQPEVLAPMLRRLSNEAQRAGNTLH